MKNKDEFVCEIHETHKDLEEHALSHMPGANIIARVARLYKAFGDETRLRILMSVMSGPLCVCDIAEVVCMTQSAVSHQLKALRDIKLVRGERQGKSIFYSLADGHVVSLIAAAMEHVNEENEGGDL